MREELGGVFCGIAIIAGFLAVVFGLCWLSTLNIPLWAWTAGWGAIAVVAGAGTFWAWGRG